VRNWKTTSAASVSAFCSFVLFSAATNMIVWPQWMLAVALFAQAGGLLAFGVAAQDYAKK
jgi:hypothetical protein